MNQHHYVFICAMIDKYSDLVDQARNERERMFRLEKLFEYQIKLMELKN